MIPTLQLEKKNNQMNAAARSAKLSCKKNQFPSQKHRFATALLLKPRAGGRGKHNSAKSTHSLRAAWAREAGSGRREAGVGVLDLPTGLATAREPPVAGDAGVGARAPGRPGPCALPVRTNAVLGVLGVRFFLQPNAKKRRGNMEPPLVLDSPQTC